MTRLALFAVLLLAPQEDKLGKMKAPEALRKSAAAFLKMKGCHVKEAIHSPILTTDGREGDAELQGKIVKDFAALKGACEAYCRAAATLVKTKTGEFQDPLKFEGEENRIGAAIRNPHTLLEELLRFGPHAIFEKDEIVDGIDCRVAHTNADEKTTMEQIKEISTRINAPWRKWIKDISAFCDRKKSSSIYKGWVNKGDYTIAKLEWQLLIVLDKKSIPFGGEKYPDEIESKYTLTYSKFDTDLEVEIPPAVKKAFKIQQ